jgi:hypothetical protein
VFLGFSGPVLSQENAQQAKNIKLPHMSLHQDKRLLTFYHICFTLQQQQRLKTNALSPQHCYEENVKLTSDSGIILQVQIQVLLLTNQLTTDKILSSSVPVSTSVKLVECCHEEPMS